MDSLLTSGDLSDKAKRVFAEEAENVLMTHGLLGQDSKQKGIYSKDPIE